MPNWGAVFIWHHVNKTNEPNASAANVLTHGRCGSCSVAMTGRRRSGMGIRRGMEPFAVASIGRGESKSLQFALLVDPSLPNTLHLLKSLMSVRSHWEQKEDQEADFGAETWCALLKRDLGMSIAKHIAFWRKKPASSLQYRKSSVPRSHPTQPPSHVRSQVKIFDCRVNFWPLRSIVRHIGHTGTARISTSVSR